MPHELSLLMGENPLEAAVLAAYNDWQEAWDEETEHRFVCDHCPLIGFPACTDGEQLVIKRVMAGEALRRARLVAFPGVAA